MAATRLFVPIFLSLATAGGSVHAQSFNVDVGSPTSSAGVPSASYAAAAGLAGTWNTLGQAVTSLNLVDVTGSPTSAVLTGPGLAAQTTPTIGVTGDDAALLSDYHYLGPGLTVYYHFENLVGGRYALYTYAWSGDDQQSCGVGGAPIACASTFSPTQSIGVGTWSGNHVLGVTYALHRMDVQNGGSFCIEVAAYGHTRLNGFQLVREGDAQVNVFCAGDGSGTSCPCGNAGISDRGCANSVDARGANLWVSGMPSIANDEVAFDAQWMPASSSILIQGTAQIAGGQGAVFGDGLRCVGGSVRRLGVHANTMGASRWPIGSESRISLTGAVTPGSVRHYQVWYRNAAAFCTSDTFNLTNGVTVTWQP